MCAAALVDVQGVILRQRPGERASSSRRSTINQGAAAARLQELPDAVGPGPGFSTSVRGQRPGKREAGPPTPREARGALGRRCRGRPGGIGGLLGASAGTTVPRQGVDRDGILDAHPMGWPIKLSCSPGLDNPRHRQHVMLAPRARNDEGVICSESRGSGNASLSLTEEAAFISTVAGTPPTRQYIPGAHGRPVEGRVRRQRLDDAARGSSLSCTAGRAGTMTNPQAPADDHARPPFIERALWTKRPSRSTPPEREAVATAHERVLDASSPLTEHSVAAALLMRSPALGNGRRPGAGVDWRLGRRLLIEPAANSPNRAL